MGPCVQINSPIRRCCCNPDELSKTAGPQFLQVDSYLERVLEVIGSADINEIEVSPEGRWRPAGTSEEFRDIMEDPSAAKPMAMLQVCLQQVLSENLKAFPLPSALSSSLFLPPLAGSISLSRQYLLSPTSRLQLTAQHPFAQILSGPV